LAVELLQLVASQIKLGAPLPFAVRGADGKLLLARGQVIQSEAQLAALMSRGIFVDLEEAKALKEGRSIEPDAKRLTLFDHWEQMLWRLDRLLKSAGQEPGFVQRCDETASHFIALVQRDVDIAIFLSVRQDARRLQHYGLTHSLHCALMCQLMATRMAWPDDRLRMLVKAALTMNLSIIDVQGRNAALGRLSEAQRALITVHPAQAVERLRAAGVDDEAWLQTVLEHHERPGGGGYPSNLTEVSEAATALRLADVFMAKISPRAERVPLTIQDAARQMFAESHGSAAASSIIKEYGIYPPGNFVQLASGELAVVIRRGATAHTPLAAAVTDKAGMPTVNTPRRDTAQPAFAIKGPALSKEVIVRVPPERLYGLAE
jgi:HD-GYP domain-containing protein (c-di-GMP phosphodiesterase class II)